jgi:hypothetical protein
MEFEYYREDTEKNIPIGKIKNLLDYVDLKKANEVCQEYLKKDDPKIEDNFQFYRKGIHNPYFFKDIHKSLEEVASSFFKRPVKKSYCFLSLYKENGFCPAHYDRPQCEYTLDLAIDFKVNKPWPIYVKNLPYESDKNDALCFSGTNHFHYRKRKLEKDEYYYLVFFHFVDKSFLGLLD